MVARCLFEDARPARKRAVGVACFVEALRFSEQGVER
jgi:hypothetical protein